MDRAVRSAEDGETMGYFDEDDVLADLLAAALEELPRHVIVSDYRTILFANHAMRDLLGVSGREGIEGQDPLHFLHPDVHEAVNERRKLLRDGSAGFRDLLVKLVAVDGRVIPAHLSITPIDHGGFRFAVLLYEPVV